MSFMPNTDLLQYALIGLEQLSYELSLSLSSGRHARGRLRIQNMPFVLAAGKFGARCTVKGCRAADLGGQQLPLQQRGTHPV